ncbi:YadA-like family protein [Pasteurella sp. P03HT]
MKHSKTAFLLALSLSNHLVAKPTPTYSAGTYYPDYTLHQIDVMDECEKSRYCEPYGTETQSISAEINDIKRQPKDKQIDSLTDYTKELAYSLKDLQDQVNTLSRDTSNTMKGVETTLNNLSSDIASHNSRITENTENLAQLSLYTTEQLADKTSSPELPGIWGVNRALNTFSVDHVDIMQQVSKQIQTLQHNMRKFDKKLNSGLAAQSALSGLFQPNEDDTINFTASLGGYHTDVALAMGMGFRFNRNVATRAGIAFSPNSRLSYNTAINFAW